MTYSSGNTIVAVDFNTFAGNSSVPSTTGNALNTIIGVGTGRSGYGQTTVPTVSANTIVKSADWGNLINSANNIARHQSSTITSITPPSPGTLVAILPALQTNLQTLFTNRNNAVAQGTSAATATTNGSTWANAITFTHTASFANANAARYFFNAGGQLALTFTHPTGAGINALWSSLSANCGTVTMSSTNGTPSTLSIAGTTFNGITKTSGGTPAPTVLSQNTGYYGLTTTNIEVFKQLANSGPASYLSSYISVNAKTNGANLAGNLDNGNLITITTLWDEVPNSPFGNLVSIGSTTTLTVKYPSISYIANTWGTVTVNGSVTGN